MISERMWKKAGIEKIPLTGAFELLPVCNLNCKMCYIHQTMDTVNENGGLIRAKEWLDYASQAKKEGLLFVLLTGGEPFLHPDFQEIYMEMKRMGLQISINSNGTLIDEKLSKWLGQNMPVRINLTLYGASEHTYESLCGNGEAFFKVQEAIKFLKKYKVPVKLNLSMTPENAADLEQMFKYANTYNLPVQAASYMFPPIRKDGTMIGQNHRLDPEMAGKIRVMADRLQGDPEWFENQAKRFENFIPLDKIKPTGEKKVEKMMCRAGRCSFWLDWQGNLCNCGMYPVYQGSLKKENFKECWKKITEKTEGLRYVSACASCPNDRICHVCTTMHYNETGTLNGRPVYLCEMNQASARYYKEYKEKAE